MLWMAPEITPHVVRGSSALADMAESIAAVTISSAEVATNLTTIQATDLQ